MSYYLDTNVILSFIFEDTNSAPATTWIEHTESPLIVGDWGKTEFHALVNRRVRSGALVRASADSGLADFAGFSRHFTASLPLSAEAGLLAADFASNPALKLTAADALHLACAAAGGYCLVTFDQRLAEAAALCGVETATPPGR